jgi:hypothetical protein
MQKIFNPPRRDESDEDDDDDDDIGDEKERPWHRYRCFQVGSVRGSMLPFAQVALCSHATH